MAGRKVALLERNGGLGSGPRASGCEALGFKPGAVAAYGGGAEEATLCASRKKAIWSIRAGIVTIAQQVG